MKYSYSWLKELSGTKLSAEKTVELLTMHSFEVEGLEKIGKDLEGVVVGKILEIKKHPNADKLQVVKIQATNQKLKTLQIVCGASNIKVGDKVPVAMIGTELPASSAGESHGLKIKEAEIRGVKSFGMLCAEDELGLGKNHSGIMILDKNVKVGMNLAEYLKLKDEVLEIKVLPDRAHDAMSYVGVAREIAALTNKKFDYDFDGLKLSKIKSKKLKVEIKDKKLCPRYIGAVIENIEVKDSPDWMKTRLLASGVRPINNIVDATNYVMLELGQPLHAFDYERLANNAQIKSEYARIVVRRAKDKEKLILLDDSQIELNSSDLLITNGEKPLALAGVMGGKDSGISQNTKTLVLESANFDAVNIRKTRTRLSLKTEASDRYEKDIDPNLCEKAMVRVIEIIEKIAGGKLEGVEDVYPSPVKSWKIKLNLDYVNKLLGEAIPAKEIIKILESLGIKTTSYKLKATSFDSIIPTFRIDLKTQEDLIEEIGRIWGYEKIKPQLIFSEVKPAKISQKMELRRYMKDILAGLGFDEVMNYSFYSRKDADNLGLSGTKHLELENPANPDQELLRISLLPNILKNVRENLKNFETLDIFEMGRVYFFDAKEKRIEKNYLSGASVFAKKSEKNFFEAKGYLEAFLQKMRLQNLEYIPDVQGMKIKSSGKEIGFLKIVSENILDSFEIKRFKGDVLVFEFDADLISELSGENFVYKQISKYPKVRRDISFMLEKNKITTKEIYDLIKKLGGKNLETVELFDIFQKENKTSLAYHLEFGASERTLENKEIDEIMGKIIRGLEKELKVEIRK
jgi:phenylalanyl-tRNA synthetase beta chain